MHRQDDVNGRLSYTMVFHIKTDKNVVFCGIFQEPLDVLISNFFID